MSLVFVLCFSHAWEIHFKECNLLSLCMYGNGPSPHSVGMRFVHDKLLDLFFSGTISVMSAYWIYNYALDNVTAFMLGGAYNVLYFWCTHVTLYLKVGFLWALERYWEFILRSRRVPEHTVLRKTPLSSWKCRTGMTLLRESSMAHCVVSGSLQTYSAQLYVISFDGSLSSESTMNFDKMTFYDDPTK